MLKVIHDQEKRRDHFTSTRMAVTKDRETASVGEAVEAQECSRTASGNGKACGHSEQQFFKILNIKDPE